MRLEPLVLFRRQRPALVGIMHKVLRTFGYSVNWELFTIYFWDLKEHFKSIGLDFIPPSE